MKTSLSVFNEDLRSCDWWNNLRRSIPTTTNTFEEYSKIRDAYLKTYHAVYSNYDLIFESEEDMTLFLLKFS
jgi:hypothetical protein